VPHAIQDPALRAIADFLRTNATQGSVDSEALRGLSNAAQAGGLAWDHLLKQYYPAGQGSVDEEPLAPAEPAQPPAGAELRAAETVLRHWLGRYARECRLPQPRTAVFQWATYQEPRQNVGPKAYRVQGTVMFGDHQPVYDFTASYTLQGNTERVTFVGLPGKARVGDTVQSVCKGDILLGTACGRCSACEDQRTQIREELIRGQNRGDRLNALSGECAGLLEEILVHNRGLSSGSSKRFASGHIAKVQTLVADWETAKVMAP
jgi:hypothetical protein